MEFRLRCEREDGLQTVLIYDNERSTLTDEAGLSMIPVELAKDHIESAKVTSKDNPVAKTKDVKTLKISLGLSCNYSCSYCSQSFVPHADSTTPDDVDAFIAKVTAGLADAPEKIEFWGGEPLVYWKTMQPLAEKLRELYPDAHFSTITNGSLLDAEKNEWFDRMGFTVGISHDGPGQHVRGPDPFDDPEKLEAILDLLRRLVPKGRASVNPMVHKDNRSRAEIQAWFNEKLGHGLPLGEGAYIDPYDEGGLDALLPSKAEHINYRLKAYADIVSGAANQFSIVYEKVGKFIDSIHYQLPLRSMGQKCGMDKPDNLAVDLNGNVTTCQNVSAVSVAPNGESHKIGTIEDLEQAKLNTATHFSQRKDCRSCPVVRLCQGSCMFLEGPMWDKACDSAFSDNIPFFAAAIKAMTGFTPYYIDGPQRADRKDIFGIIDGVPEENLKKPFPIPVVAG